MCAHTRAPPISERRSLSALVYEDGPSRWRGRDERIVCDPGSMPVDERQMSRHAFSPMGPCRRPWAVVGWFLDKEVPMPIVIEITAGMLLAFFWAFWVFAFAGWWCGGGC